MPVNEFEKQVQQKMDELQLRPSNVVWEEVEKRIRKEKKRRWFIIWFFLFGVLLLGGTAWWLTGINKKQAPANNSVAQTTSEKKINEIAINIKSDAKNEIIPEKGIDNSNEIKPEKPSIQSTNVLAITKTESVQKKKEPHAVPAAHSYKEDMDINNSAPYVLKKKKTNKTNHGLPAITKNDQPVVIEKIDSADNGKTTGRIAKADINTMIKDTVTADKNIVRNDPVADKQETVFELKDSLVAKRTEDVLKKDKPKAKKNKWEFGINGMAGISGISDNISIFDRQKNYDAFSLSSSVTGPVTPQVTTVAEPTNGFSWQIGAYAKRKLNARTGISAGLNFSSYSTIQRTGSFVDSSRVFNNSSRYSSSVSAFYRNGSGDSYKNHYYYLELPFSFHWQVNKGMKLPVILQSGFSAGFFTGSDALIYNSGSNVFYRDNKLFYKTQFSYQAGLYTKLFSRAKNPLTAGILFNYHLSKLQKENSNGNNHLASFGIQLGWLLKK